jgi:hypothetical protein
MTALPQTNDSAQPLPLAVTLTTDQARAILNALDVMDLHYCTLSERQVEARRALKQQLGGGR